MGNERLEVFPVWEIFLSRLPEGSWAIATESVKWNPRYQRKHRIKTGEAKGLPPAVTERVQKLAKRIYKNLYLSGYARIDFRMDAQEKVYVLEANPNPQLALGEDFADSAECGRTSLRPAPPANPEFRAELEPAVASLDQFGTSAASRLAGLGRKPTTETRSAEPGER